MSHQVYQVYLTREDAERLTFCLPLNYCLLSNQMRYKPVFREQKPHLETILNEQLLKRQCIKSKLSKKDNYICNQILGVMRIQEWRFKIIQKVLTSYNQTFVSLNDIDNKLTSKMYQNIDSFISHFNILISNKKMKNLNSNYLQESKRLEQILLGQIQRFQLSRNKGESNEKNNKVGFSQKDKKQLESILPQLQARYLNQIPIIIGRDNVRTKKDNSFLDFELMSAKSKDILLEYARNCLKQQQSKQVSRFSNLDIQNSSPSGFDSETEQTPQN